MAVHERERSSYGAGRERALGWGWLAMTGIALVLLGAVAIGSAFLTGIVTMAFLGALLAIGGVGEVIGAFRLRGRAFWPLLLGGLLSVVVGAVLLWRPIAGLAAAGALIGAFLVTAGAFRALTSVVDRYEHWGWDFVLGLASAALGLGVLVSWPLSSLNLVGAIVGVELAMRGGVWLSAAVIARRVQTREPPATAARA